MAKAVRVVIELADGKRIYAKVWECVFNNPGSIAPLYEGFTERMAKSGSWEAQMVLTDIKLDTVEDVARKESLYGSLFTPKTQTDGMAEMERRANLRKKGVDPDEDRGVNTKRFSAIEYDEE